MRLNGIGQGFISYPAIEWAIGQLIRWCPIKIHEPALLQATSHAVFRLPADLMALQKGFCLLPSLLAYLRVITLMALGRYPDELGGNPHSDALNAD